MPFSSLKGRKLMLVKMVYHPMPFSSNNKDGIKEKDYLSVVYRDLVTDKTEIFIIEEPTIEIFVVKPEYRTFRSPVHFIEMDKCDRKVVKYNRVKYEIAKIGGEGLLKQYRELSDKKQIFKYPYVLGGDIDIETYYRTLWEIQCGNDIRKIPNTTFMDIEVDQIDYTGAMAKHGECEINAIAFIDNTSNTVYQFLYDNGKNPLIKDFMERQDEYQKMLHEAFDEFYGVLDYKILMYENEVDMLIDFFKLVHTLKRDMMLIWNGFGFDIPYIMDRFKTLQISPMSVMCSNEFPRRFMHLYSDFSSFDFATKKDSFIISDVTNYVDQTITYAALRKSKGVIRKVSLGYVSEHELKDTKLDYKDVGNIRTLPYEDYFRFSMYNIKDTLLQKGIDNKCKDTENLYLISNINCVSLSDALKQTVVFRGFMYSRFYQKGIILGHNVNYDNENNPELANISFEGALVSDPLLNTHTGLNIYNGKSKYLFGYTIDFDFKAMYPNMIVVFNIFATTLIGKLYIEPKYMVDYIGSDVGEGNDVVNNLPDSGVLGKDYVEDLIAKNVINLGSKWHKLSTISELDKKIKMLGVA